MWLRVFLAQTIPKLQNAWINVRLPGLLGDWKGSGTAASLGRGGTRALAAALCCFSVTEGTWKQEVLSPCPWRSNQRLLGSENHRASGRFGRVSWVLSYSKISSPHSLKDPLQILVVLYRQLSMMLLLAPILQEVTYFQLYSYHFILENSNLNLRKRPLRKSDDTQDQRCGLGGQKPGYSCLQGLLQGWSAESLHRFLAQKQQVVDFHWTRPFLSLPLPASAWRSRCHLSVSIEQLLGQAQCLQSWRKMSQHVQEVATDFPAYHFFIFFFFLLIYTFSYCQKGFEIA